MRRKPGAIDLPGSAVKIIDDTAVSSQTARQSASQLTDLASRFESSGANGGTYATANEWLKKQTGTQNYMTALRQEYTRLRSTQVNTLLPPGPASDTDIKNAMAGFPGENSDPKQLASFMRGMAKLQNYSAQVDEAKGEWAGAVGNLGRTSKDIEIGGVKVPAGTTFPEFSKQFLKAQGANTQSPAQDQRARLLNLYGGK